MNPLHVLLVPAISAISGAAAAAVAEPRPWAKVNLVGKVVVVLVHGISARPSAAKQRPLMSLVAVNLLLRSVRRFGIGLLRTQLGHQAASGDPVAGKEAWRSIAVSRNISGVCRGNFFGLEKKSCGRINYLRRLIIGFVGLKWPSNLVYQRDELDKKTNFLIATGSSKQA